MISWKIPCTGDVKVMAKELILEAFERRENMALSALAEALDIRLLKGYNTKMSFNNLFAIKYFEQVIEEDIKRLPSSAKQVIRPTIEKRVWPLISYRLWQTIAL